MSDSEEEAGGFGGSDSEGEGKTLVLTIACCPHLLWTSLATVGVWLGAFLTFPAPPPAFFFSFPFDAPPRFGRTSVGGLRCVPRVVCAVRWTLETWLRTLHYFAYSSLFRVKSCPLEVRLSRTFSAITYPPSAV